MHELAAKMYGGCMFTRVYMATSFSTRIWVGMFKPGVESVCAIPKRTKFGLAKAAARLGLWMRCTEGAGVVSVVVGCPSKVASRLFSCIQRSVCVCVCQREG